TGGQRSTINGTLRSTIPNANVFFMNSAGVSIGPRARLVAPASVTITTADQINLSDGRRFATTMIGDDLLSSAAPADCGFLAPQCASSISLRGDHRSLLGVGPGRYLSLVGGAISSRAMILDSIAGQVNVVAIDHGEVLLDLSQSIPVPRPAPGATGASIE